MELSRTKKIVIWACVAVFAAAQAVGLFFLIRVEPAASLTLSETAITLQPDGGRQILHTIEPASAGSKRLSYSVSISGVAWVDGGIDMIIGLEPGSCRVRAELDGLEAFVDVTVAGETALAGVWQGDGAAVTLDGALSGRFGIGEADRTLKWMRTAFYEGETDDAYRYVKLTAASDGRLYTLLYDRLNDTMRLRTDGEKDRILVRIEANL